MIPVNIMGLQIKNPIILAAGPWSRGYDKIKKAFDMGAGAVVTESIVSEPYPLISPCLAYDGYGVQNSRMYSGLNLEAWQKELTAACKDKRKYGDRILIANIMASTPSEIGYLAHKIEKTGVDAIELGLSCPVGEGSKIVSCNEDKVYEFTKEAVKSVSIPVIVKLSQDMMRLPELVLKAEEAGASALSAIDTVRCILGVDIKTGMPVLPAYGGYSGAPIRPIGLAVTAGIAQSTSLPLIGIGGIGNFENLLEYIMLGACAGQIGTEVLIRGYDVIAEIAKDLEKWSKETAIKDWDEIRGCALKGLKSFEEIKEEPKAANLTVSCTNVDCSKCIICCLENAISFDKTLGNALTINRKACTGCGMCIGICPEKKIEINWK